VLAQMYGLPRIAMLRQFRSTVHVGQALARLIAAQPKEEVPTPVGEQRYGYVSLPDTPHVSRDQQSDEERARRDAETNAILAQLKAEQEA